MARCPTKLPLAHVSSLTLGAIIEHWTKEADIPKETLERELRLATQNLTLNWREGERIDPATRNDQLPDLETPVERDWLQSFCEKQGWTRPEFWFPPEKEDVRPVGRPSDMPAILQELERRAEAGEMCERVTEEARHLAVWLQEQRLRPMTVKSLVTQIGQKYRELKQAQ